MTLKWPCGCKSTGCLATLRDHMQFCKNHSEKNQPRFDDLPIFQKVPVPNLAITMPIANLVINMDNFRWPHRVIMWRKLAILPSPDWKTQHDIIEYDVSERMAILP